ncbi:MAG: NlpC/P60 family protein [Enterobacterales bacterium endosymbiont of Blomia tropicalis]|uniref:C40 family peptidase n=1 Tax=Mixta mediterraneensis TaxID=2758443 RepID=UPI0025A8C3AD|nr:NlpC/P60 family protein [Mixta mediterraneensis]MDL4915989.1 NlpC/P60 family protein [Mixta mediterraneensis]
MKSFEIARVVFCLSFALLVGCSSHSASPHKNLSVDADDTASNADQQPDLIPVIAALHDQMHSWEGTPYHWGGTKLSGVDCSGFVWRTLKDRFNIPMDRVTTSQLIHMGKRVDKNHLQPGDLVFFRIHHEMHVGFYDTDHQFLHASSSKGVMRSSLMNPYWQRVYFQARRLPKEYNAEITFNAEPVPVKLAKN